MTNNDTTRLYADASSRENYRSEYRRDYARVIHSAAFRRLQNKTQLFPGQESDFFRNRLTHSLEVAQISKTIALKLLQEDSTLSIEPDVCEIAGLIHDLGHPPFGHNGETALNHCMKSYGGFEGNAQSLRIITKLEKKAADEEYHKEFRDELRNGLNLTSRVIASVLKYDRLIPGDSDSETVIKGYYQSEEFAVRRVKENLVGSRYAGNFRTIECYIMDVSDDIAYSTYDIEDAFKAGFLTPIDMMAADESIFEQIRDKLISSGIDATVADCKRAICAIFSRTWKEVINKQKLVAKNKHFSEITLGNFMEIYKISNDIAKNGYLRTDFTSSLVKQFVSGIRIDKNPLHPILSKVYLEPETLLHVNVLKHFAYVCLINSSRLKVAEHRGYEIVRMIYESLSADKGVKLMSEDFQRIIEKQNIPKRRVVCDYIAGMTDRHALEIYNRLYSENPQSIFKPF